MATIKRKQGNALWLNVPASNMDIVDETWANWSGTLTIKDSADQVVVTQPLIKGTVLGEFYLHLGSAFMNTVGVGTYSMIIEVKNTTVDYLEEGKAHTLIITAQEV